MRVIDSDNYQASGIETMFFPGGEPHVKLPRFKEPLLLHFKLRTWNDVAFAALIQSALDQVTGFWRAFIPYFPGARMDRTSEGLAPFTVEVMGRLLDYGWTCVFDPHSEEVENQARPKIFMPTDLDIPIEKDVVGIIAPDQGATNRATDFRDKFYPGAYLVQGSKVRDPKTGNLSNYQLPSLVRTGTYIVVDDICDGGGTFNLLQQAFDSQEIGLKSSLNLFVSHGIFSKGLSAISGRYTKITTTDSWCDSLLLRSPRLTVIPLLPLAVKYMKEEFAC